MVSKKLKLQAKAISLKADEYRIKHSTGSKESKAIGQRLVGKEKEKTKIEQGVQKIKDSISKERQKSIKKYGEAARKIAKKKVVAKRVFKKKPQMVVKIGGFDDEKRQLFFS